MLMSRDEVSREVRLISEDAARVLHVPLSPDAVNYLATVPSDFMSEATEIDVIIPILRRTIHDILHQAKMYNTGTVDEGLIKHIMSTSPRRYLWYC
jgi:hypothetical protein